MLHGEEVDSINPRMEELGKWDCAVLFCGRRGVCFSIAFAVKEGGVEGVSKGRGGSCGVDRISARGRPRRNPENAAVRCLVRWV